MLYEASIYEHLKLSVDLRFLFCWVMNDVMFKIQNFVCAVLVHILSALRYGFRDLCWELYLCAEVHWG